MPVLTLKTRWLLHSGLVTCLQGAFELFNFKKIQTVKQLSKLIRFAIFLYKFFFNKVVKYCTFT